MTQERLPDAELDPRERELDILAFGVLLVRNARLIAGVAVLFWIVVTAYVYIAKPRYTAIAQVVIPQQQSTSTALAAQLQLGAADLLGSAFDLYSDIIKSRTVTDAVIKDNDLQKAYGNVPLDRAEVLLAGSTKVQAEREGLITVSVQDTDAQRAADIANDYVRQLKDTNSRLSIDAAQEQAKYLEAQLVSEKNQLADAEVALKEMEEHTSGLPPEAQVTAGLSAVQTTRTQLRAAQVQLGALRASETDANPDVVRVKRQIDELSSQLASLESGSPNSENGTPFSKVPERTLEYTRRLRDVKFHETVFELIARQYESAKEKETDHRSNIELLDMAVKPRTKSWPPRTLYSAGALLAGFILGILLVIVRGFIQTYVSHPRNADKLHQLRSAWAKPKQAKA